MSHVSSLSPALATFLLRTSALVQAPPPAAPSNPTATASDQASPPQVAVHRMSVNSDELAETMARGVAAARSLIADPKPYRINVDSLKAMVEAVEVIAGSELALSMPAETYDLMHECIRAERVRCHRKGVAWAVAETVAAKAARDMFAFSEAQRQSAAWTVTDRAGSVVTHGSDAFVLEA